jgi:hypothetical protein
MADTLQKVSYATTNAIFRLLTHSNLCTTVQPQRSVSCTAPITVVNNQLSGAGKVEIDLIDFLFKPSIYLYRFNSSPIGLDT